MINHFAVIALALLQELLNNVDGYTASELLNSTVKSGAECAWNYVESGQDWAKAYPLCASGTHQSPVALWTEDVTVDSSMPPLQLLYYNESLDHSVLENNCHSTELKPISKRLPTVSGGGLEHTYEFVQLHVHWGTEDQQGSEDRFGDIQFPAEIHMVHKRIVNDGTNYDRSKDPKAFAVIALLLELSDKSSETLERITDAMSNVTFAGFETRLSNVKLSDLFPRNMGNFIRYHGSLTTPPCTEAVEWIIIPAPIPITQQQLNSMRKVQLSPVYSLEPNVVSSNFRPPQPLNGRIVKSRYFVSGLPRNVKRLANTQNISFLVLIFGLAFFFSFNYM